MKVKLSATRYHKIKPRFVNCRSFEHASQICEKFIKDNALIAADFLGGQIINSKKRQIARISYNGRIWPA